MSLKKNIPPAQEMGRQIHPKRPLGVKYRNYELAQIRALIEGTEVDVGLQKIDISEAWRPMKSLSLRHSKARGSDPSLKTESEIPHCSICGEPGHRSVTCPEEAKAPTYEVVYFVHAPTYRAHQIMFDSCAE